MTDEEIEKGLQAMLLHLNWGTVERAGSVSTDGSGDYKYGGVPKDIAVVQATLDYINRLKSECESKENYTIEQHAEIHRLRDELKQVRKDTAKEILERLLKWKSSIIFDTESVLLAEKNFEDCIKALAVEEYGVEVDDE